MDRISALIDGELDERQAQKEFLRIKHNNDLRECWDTFHLIRDTMRGESHFSPRLGGRLSECLAREAAILAPHRSAAKRATTYVLSLAASVAAVGIVAWVALSSNPFNPPRNMPQELAKGPVSAAIPVSTVPQPVVVVPNLPSDGDMNEYLLAHQEFSPSTVIQGVVPYIRTVSTDQSPQNR